MTKSTSTVIKELVERFERNEPAYKKQGYNEASVRQEFINPLFEKLGWDIYNKEGRAEAYKDVIHEDAIKIGGETKAPDYCFRIGGVRKFFLEAKKPSVNIKEDADSSYQLRRYAWSAKLPLSILTNFEGFAVYDCRIRPKEDDKASVARIEYWPYNKYIEKWDEIEGIFSKDAIFKGSFDKFVESTKKKRGTAEVDSEFLKEIENWRELVAKNIAIRNTDLSVQDLNFSVQRTIDRIIFLRMCEDRSVEPYGRLRLLLETDNTYASLCKTYKKADEKYNSGLFHFIKEKGRATPTDEITLNLTIDDKVLKEIIKHLYYPESPYEFSVLSPEVLGNVYEQFLGKVIRLTPGHRAKVEEKPEVKKAGGVYYTPQHIVDYIVKNTVGKLCKMKAPRQVSKVRILDPACGSGSFLLGAYTHLLDYHLDYYMNRKNPKRYKDQIYQGRGGQWFLTIKEKKRILLNNIYGVDIDRQAVEVTKLSLLLRVLEGESKDVFEKQQKLWQERALPDLGNNIKCGNSLTDSDFYEDGIQTKLFDGKGTDFINIFDWNKEFREIMDNGGFDAVIGNPPYVRIQALKEWYPLAVEYYKQKYVSASKGNYDIYVVFVEKGLNLLRKDGRLGYILPSKFFTTDYGASLRTLLTESGTIDKVIDFGHVQVFENATTYTCLLFLDKSHPRDIQYLKVLPKELSSSSNKVKKIPADSLGSDIWIFLDESSQILLDKINRIGVPLLELPASVSRGTSTGNDNLFCLVKSDGKLITRDGKAVDIEPEILRTPLYATDFTRYHFSPKSNEKIIFPYDVNPTGYELIEEKKLRQEYPKAYDYLRSRKKELENRKQYKHWYAYSAPRNLHIHDQADIFIPLLADRGLFSPAAKNNKKFCMMASAGFSISLKNAETKLNPLYVLGLINSKLLFWKLHIISNKFRGGWITCTKQYFGTLPIRSINFDEPEEVTQHNKMVKLVERMLTHLKQLAKAKSPDEKQVLQRQIDATEQQINTLVYELYGLTQDEIKIIEGAI